MIMRIIYTHGGTHVNYRAGFAVPPVTFLAIVKHILLRHQAALEIASTAGIGSTFGAAFPEWRVRPLSEHRA